MAGTVSNIVMESFKADFDKIKGKEFKSNRRSNTGIGKTFEDIIGVEENNNLLVDYKGEIELKSQRAYTQSKITLFTKAPTSPSSATSSIVEKYGSPDPVYPQHKIIHSCAQGTNFNSLKGRWGFKLDVRRDECRVYLLIKDLQTGKIVENDIYWSFDNLKERVETKCKNIAYITAKTKKIGEEEYFTFDKAVLLSGLTFDAFLDHIENDTIVFEIRKGVYKSGKNKGQPHDHGGGFRIAKKKIDLVFKREQI
jgi:hypothetical protein